MRKYMFLFAVATAFSVMVSCGHRKAASEAENVNDTVMVDTLECDTIVSDTLSVEL